MDPEGPALYDVMVDNFNWAYNGNRAPVPLWVHYPWTTRGSNLANARRFLEWALVQEGVYVVTAHQLVSWMQAPVPISGMDQWLGCERGGVAAGAISGENKVPQVPSAAVPTPPAAVLTPATPPVPAPPQSASSPISTTTPSTLASPATGSDVVQCQTASGCNPKPGIVTIPPNANGQVIVWEYLYPQAPAPAPMGGSAVKSVWTMVLMLVSSVFAAWALM
jgi:hypothetical protein